MYTYIDIYGIIFKNTSMYHCKSSDINHCITLNYSLQIFNPFLNIFSQIIGRGQKINQKKYC